jgi:hypothetical protein
MIFVGVDWAEAHHDVHVMDEDAKRLGGGFGRCVGGGHLDDDRADRTPRERARSGF